MKKKAIKVMLTILFFLMEILLPACIVVSYHSINEARISYQFKKYDLNNDGVVSEEEQTGDYEHWANAYYGDGARNVFVMYLSLVSICLGVIFKIIFFLGSKLKKFIYGKYNL